MSCSQTLKQMAIGGAVALGASLYGFYLLKDGIDDVSSTLEALGVPVESHFRTLLSMTNYLVIPNFIIYIYGQREYVRRYDHKCGHGKGLIHWAFKAAIFKPVIGSMVLFTFTSCLITLVVIEAVYIYFLALDFTCEGTQDAIETILELMNSNINVTNNDDLSDSASVNTICGAIGKGNEGAEQATTALIILVCAQILTLGYWMKYSTIGAAPMIPFPSHPDDPENMYRDKKDDAFYKKRKSTVDHNKRRGSAAAFYNVANPPRGSVAGGGGRRGSSAPPPASDGANSVPTNSTRGSVSADRPPTQEEEDARIGREAREAVEKKRKEEQIHNNLAQMRKQAEMLLKTPQELHTHEIEIDSDDDNHRQVEKNRPRKPKTAPVSSSSFNKGPSRSTSMNKSPTRSPRKNPTPTNQPPRRQTQSPSRPTQPRGQSFSRASGPTGSARQRGHSPPPVTPLDGSTRAPRKF